MTNKTQRSFKSPSLAGPKLTSPVYKFPLTLILSWLVVSLSQLAAPFAQHTYRGRGSLPSSLVDLPVEDQTQTER